jgi:F-type H+-transporting ATPase subunit b
MTLDLDITYVIVLALFLLPLAILNGIVIRPFLRLFEERHEKLEGAIDRAEDMLEEAERRAATFEERIKVATEKGIDARARIRSEAIDAMNARIAEERERMQKKLDEALEGIARERDAALAGIGKEAEGMADTMAKKLLGRAS